MKKITFLLTLLVLFIQTPKVFAIELQGGVKFNVDSARDYVREGQSNTIQITGHDYFQNDDTVGRIVYSYNNEKEIVGITVQYKNDSKMAYIYGKNNNLKYVEKYDRDVNLYPHRGYRYNLDGKLILTSLTVSKDEMFRFTPEGKLLAHSMNGIIYDESGNPIGSASGK